MTTTARTVLPSTPSYAHSPASQQTLGLTKGCECGGKKVTRNKVIIKALDATRDPAAHQKAGNVAAFLAQDQKLRSTTHTHTNTNKQQHAFSAYQHHTHTRLHTHTHTHTHTSSDAFSATSGQLDFENKLMYFGSIDGTHTCAYTNKP
jgi:hypothetical protein